MEEAVNHRDLGNFAMSEPTINESKTGLEPALDVPEKMIGVHLASDADIDQCPFWIALFRPGTLTPQDLLDLRDPKKIMMEAATTGVADSGPIMLSDSSAPNPTYLYLLPAPDKKIDSNSPWLRELVTTVASWTPRKVGVFLAPEVAGSHDVQQTLCLIMHELIVHSSSQEYFLLPGEHGTNVLLNAALQLRSLLHDEKTSIYVFH